MSDYNTIGAIIYLASSQLNVLWKVDDYLIINVTIFRAKQSLIIYIEMKILKFLKNLVLSKIDMKLCNKL